MTTPSPLSPVVGEAQASPVPEPPDDSRIEFTHGMTVLAYWSSSGAAVANGYSRKERWRGYGRNAGWSTWAEMVATFGESLRSLVLLKPYFPPEPLELTPEEQAAKERSEHMSTCHEEACVECMKELRVIRRIVKAIRPVIEDQAYQRGYGQGRDDEAADAPTPVAAALDPTPIPDGEPR